jgi:hypothetical protein
MRVFSSVSVALAVQATSSWAAPLTRDVLDSHKDIGIVLVEDRSTGSLGDLLGQIPGLDGIINGSIGDLLDKIGLGSVLDGGLDNYLNGSVIDLLAQIPGLEGVLGDGVDGLFNSTLGNIAHNIPGLNTTINGDFDLNSALNTTIGDVVSNTGILDGGLDGILNKTIAELVSSFGVALDVAAIGNSTVQDILAQIPGLSDYFGGIIGSLINLIPGLSDILKLTVNDLCIKIGISGGLNGVLNVPIKDLLSLIPGLSGVANGNLDSAQNVTIGGLVDNIPGLSSILDAELTAFSIRLSKICSAISPAWTASSTTA